MKTRVILILVATAVISTLLTRSLASTIGIMREGFDSIPGVPPILDHLMIDDSNVARDESSATADSKVITRPAFVISGLPNGLTVKKMIGIHNTGLHRNALRITNSDDARNNPCWGIDYALGNSLIFRHYAKGFHPTSFSTQKQYDDYYQLLNWFLRLIPSVPPRYGYTPIFS